MTGLPKWSLSDDKTEAVVDFPTTPPVQFRLSGEELDDFIISLSRMRADMPAPPPTDPDFGSRIEIPAATRWWIEPRGDGGLTLLIWRPGIRWVGALVAPEDAHRFAAIAKDGANKTSPGKS